MAKFKVGDKVRVTTRENNSSYVGTEGKIIRIESWANNGRLVAYVDTVNNGSGTCFYLETLDKLTNNNMNLIERASLAFKGEPEKSFIKAGIIDANEIPTDDGVKLVIAQLLKDKEFSAKFKTNVVDPILAEEVKK